MTDANIDYADDGPEVDALAHEVLEQIAAEVRTIHCPVHGTPATAIVGEGGIKVETCCEALDEAVDAAFPEGEDDDEAEWSAGEA
jgi:hypothetical protein